MRTKRNSLIEERNYEIKRAQMRLMSMVQERVAKLQISQVPYFPNDLMFEIFLLLPIKSLSRFNCVCKAWYKLIHCAEFVNAFNSKAETIPIPILLRKLDYENPNAFHVETQVSQSENFSLFPSRTSSNTQPSKFIHCLEIGDQKGKITNLNITFSGSIVASCNGLILIVPTNRTQMRTAQKRRPPGRLIVMNPVTRKFIGFPPGTLPGNLRYGGDYNFLRESYGLIFSHFESTYKVVHLFNSDTSEFTSCEIFNLKTGLWKAVDGPSQGLLRIFRHHQPISAIGALHWLPLAPPFSYEVDYIVSMGVENERFSKTLLPRRVGTNIDSLLEMGGFLSFLNMHKETMEVWILKGLEGGEWVKQHSIPIDDYAWDDRSLNTFSIPLLALNAKEMLFREPYTLYIYDFELGKSREIEMEDGNIKLSERIIPYSNSLATWETLEPMS